MDVLVLLQATLRPLKKCVHSNLLFENNLIMLRQNLQGSTMSFLTPALDFASNLSYTIIRETQQDDDRSEHSDDSTDTTISITDEELQLLGHTRANE